MKKLKKYIRTAGLLLFILLSGFGMGIDPNIFKPKRMETEKNARTELPVKKDEDEESRLQELR